MIQFEALYKLRYRQMVNTFLFTHDFRDSAHLMDRARLGKQRPEGKQILNNIITIRVLSSHLGIDVRTVGISSAIKTIKTWIVNTAVPQGHKITLDEFGNMIDPAVTCPSATSFEVKKLGFASHPCTSMWYGYEDALKDYINCHIYEWVSRGYKNDMVTYTLTSSTYERPPWTDMPEVYNMFKCACLYKEIIRDEKPWYQLQNEFVTAFMCANIPKIKSSKNYEHYIWPSIFDESWRSQMLNMYPCIRSMNILTELSQT